MGIAASSSPPPPAEPSATSAPLSPPTTEAIAASTPPREAVAPPTTEATDPAAKEAPATDAGADGAAETVVVDVAAESGKEGEGEEEGECGFCLFMKGGGCKEEFVAWEKCVEEAEAAGKDDVVERCHDVTATLRKCMDAHADYYEPILRAERAMAEDLEAAQSREASGSEPAPSSSPEASAPATALEEEGQKKQVDEVPDSNKKSEDPAA